MGLEVKRVKDVPGDYRITDRIIRMIWEARLIVADLTYERPNVYFEIRVCAWPRKNGNHDRAGRYSDPL